VGRHPYPITGSVREVLQNIAELEPVRPSSLRGDLNDDLDTILLRALAKDRDRRYGSVDQLADDIRAFLDGRPIAAKRDQLGYVIMKTLARHRLATFAAAAILVMATVAMIGGLRVRSLRHQALANEVTELLVHSPAEARAMLAVASAAVVNRVTSAVAAAVDSVAYTQRITGARGALLLDPRSFWAGVDGGPLWQHGEWLEACELPAEAIAPLIPEMLRMATGGTDRQRYAAYCLLGCTGAARGTDATFWQERMTAEIHPGVAAAARWAANQGHNEALPPTIIDEISRLPFVSVPSADAYLQGASADDPDRYADESASHTPRPISSFHLSATEVTWSAWELFLNDPTGVAAFSENPRQAMNRHLDGLAETDRPNAAVGMITLSSARAYCNWLSQRGAAAVPARRYRLPTEAEWEHAARGGNSARFCFGDDVRYARHFANCDSRALDGITPRWPITGRHMPNFYGLFDMHGGLWEWTDSRYPAELLDTPELAAQELWVYRGGASYSSALRCRSTQRNYGVANRATDYHGFRIVMEMLP